MEISAQMPGFDLTLPQGRRLIATLKTDGVTVASLKVSGVSQTHIQVAGPNLPVKQSDLVELELADDTIRLNQTVLVESCDRFGFLGRLVQPSDVFLYWVVGLPVK